MAASIRQAVASTSAAESQSERLKKPPWPVRCPELGSCWLRRTRLARRRLITSDSTRAQRWACCGLVSTILKGRKNPCTNTGQRSIIMARPLASTNVTLDTTFIGSQRAFFVGEISIVSQENAQFE